MESVMDKVINKDFGLEDYSQTMSFQCLDAIEISLFIEKEGLRFYEKAAKNVFDRRVRDMFLRLANEEKDHVQTLQTKIQYLRPAISGKGKAETRADVFVNEELKGKIFSSSDAETVKKYKSDVKALEYGIESEKRSINILSQLLENEKKLDVKTVFTHLIVEEKQHLALLEGLRKNI